MEVNLLAKVLIPNSWRDKRLHRSKGYKAVVDQNPAWRANRCQWNADCRRYGHQPLHHLFASVVSRSMRQDLRIQVN
jgi:hypothetical protein